mgnify:CR=1 FL=1
MLPEFARKFAGVKTSAGDRSEILNELGRLGYTADAQAANHKPVGPLAPSAQLTQEIPSSPPRKMARFADGDMHTPLNDIKGLQFDKNPMHVRKSCHGITDESACVRCCACAEILHARCIVGTENVMIFDDKLVLCCVCAAIFNRSGDGIIEPIYVSAISKLHSVAIDAMKKCAIQLFADSALTRDKLMFISQALKSPLLEMAMMHPQVATNVARDPKSLLVLARDHSTTSTS